MRVVVCALAKNEHLYINDWVNHYLLLGFDKIYIYDNDDFDSPYIGDFIKNKDKVEIIDIRGRKEVNMHQRVFTNFYDNFAFDWCLFCDIDEFLVGIGSIKGFLKLPYVRNYNQIRIKWRLYGDDDLIERDMKQPVYKVFKRVLHFSLHRNLKQSGTLQNQGKALVRGGLRNVVFCSPHFASYGTKSNVIPSILPNGKLCYSMVEIKENYNGNTIFLDHYMTKSLSEFVNQKLNRNDAVYNQLLTLDYYWRINKKTSEKIKYLKEKKLWDISK